MFADSQRYLSLLAHQKSGARTLPNPLRCEPRFKRPQKNVGVWRQVFLHDAVPWRQGRPNPERGK